MAYPGGKNGSGTYQKLINLMPPHREYIEPCLGSGTIMRLKRPATSSIGIDSDEHVIENFRAGVPGLTLLNVDALRWLANADVSSDTLIYLDPPYLMSTRLSKRALYRHEFNDEQHGELLHIITRLPCMVMISGYWSRMYAAALRGWRTVTFQARTRGGKMATEWVWLNFAEPLELHDYRYLGADYRERERIKRKQLRWRNRLQHMDSLERYALLNCIEGLRSLASSEMAGAARATPARNGGAVEHTTECVDAAASVNAAVAAAIAKSDDSGRYRQK
jgi:hypothetical protein